MIFKNFKINSITKLAIINTLVGLILAFILYFFLPYILNYPANTINNDFQIEMTGATYTMQYFILVCILAILVFLTFKISHRKISNVDINSKNEIENFRKHCFNYPYFTILIQSFLPPIVCGILLVLFKTDFELLMRICIVILSVSAIYSTTSYMIGKNFFEKKLIETSSLTRHQLSGIKLNIYKKLIIQTFPLFLYSSVLMLLISISTMSTEKGDLIYNSYQQELKSSFSEDYVYNLNDAKDILQSLHLNSEQDYVVMFSANNGSIYYAEQPINEFLVKYTLNYYDSMKGQCFEYYGQNSQASLLKIHSTQGDFYVGIHFTVFASKILAPFFIVAIFTILFNIFYIYYIGKGLSNDLNNIVTALKNISNSENILLASNLSVTSNDEIGNLTLAFNKIQDLTKLHVEQLQENQDKLMEKERLASLGQLIGRYCTQFKNPYNVYCRCCRRS